MSYYGYKTIPTLNIKHDENQNSRSGRNDNRTQLIVGIVEIKNDKNDNKMCHMKS